MNCNRVSIVQNIKGVLKRKNLKMGDIEREAGVSPGYLSRWAVESDKSAGSLIDFLVTVSKQTMVPVDGLLLGHYGALTESETRVSNFLERLLFLTTQEELQWNFDYTSRFAGPGSDLQLPFLEANRDEICEYIYQYYSSIKKEYYTVGDRVLYCSPTDKLDVYILNVGTYNSIPDYDVVVMTGDHNWQTLACTRSDEAQPFSDVIYKLAISAWNSCSHVKLNKETKSAIDEFLSL